MTIEAMKQALEHVQEFKRRWWAVPPFGNKVNKATREAVSAAHSPIFQLEDTIRAAIEQAEKQVECMCGICKLGKREWVGLTNKDIIEMWPETSTVGWEDIRLIEAKLKEKNHD